MESKSKIAAALVNAKKAFNPALKNATNPHLKNRYANLEACLNAVDDALLANGIFLYQETSENETGVTVETVFLHESGEELRTGKLHVPAPKQDPQGYGSALTYARRYSLVTSCGIAQEDDDGNAGSSKRQEPGQKVESQKGGKSYKRPSPKQEELIKSLISSHVFSEVEKAKYTAVLQEDGRDWSGMINHLNGLIKERELPKDGPDEKDYSAIF